MKDKAVEAVEYSAIELEFRQDLIDKMVDAKDQREQRYIQFDDQTYLEWRKGNQKARNAYIAPKVNEEDIRTTSGTTREKTNTMLSYLLNLNLGSTVIAYDGQDKKDAELGVVATDLITKSYKLEPEDYDTKMLLLCDEFLTHGDVFAEDTPVEFSIPDKEIISFGENFKDIKWEEKEGKISKYLCTHLIDGANVYLGNIKEPIIENQPYIITRRLIPRSEAKSIYGKWERWKNVPHQLTITEDDSANAMPYNNWTLEAFKQNYVEELKFQCKWSNDYMVMLNGVMMFPVVQKMGKASTVPLSYINGVAEYTITQGSYEKRPGFAYSVSIPAKTKVDQAIYDEMLKSIILKTRKSFMPPLANKGKSLSRKVFFPGTITNDVDPDKIKEIGTNNGVTPSEFQVTQFLKDIIDQKSLNPIMEGQSSPGRQTAREILELKQQSMMKAGRTIFGWSSFIQRLSWLRLQSIINNWTEPLDSKVLAEGLENIYRNISMDTTFGDGVSGERQVQFSENIPEDSQVTAEEDIMSEVQGKRIRKNYINPVVWKSAKYNYFINVEPVEKDSNVLRAARFEETLAKALQLFSPFGKLPNMEYAAERVATLNGENPEKFWQSAPDPQQLQAAQMMGQPAQGGGPSLGQQMQPPSPSLTQAVG